MEKLKASDILQIDDNFIDKVADRVAEKMKSKEVDNPYYTTNEVAKILNVTRHTIIRYVDSYFNPEKYPKTQRLKATKGGRTWLIRKSDLEAYLKNPQNPEYNEE